MTNRAHPVTMTTIHHSWSLLTVTEV